MGIYIKTEDTKWRTSRISVETALELYEGGLYKLLQQEYGDVVAAIQANKDNIKLGQAILKRYEQAGIKPPKETA